MVVKIKIVSRGGERKLFVNGERITGFTGLKVDYLDSFDSLPEVTVSFTPAELGIDIESDVASLNAREES